MFQFAENFHNILHRQLLVFTAFMNQYAPYNHFRFRHILDKLFQMLLHSRNLLYAFLY